MWDLSGGCGQNSGHLLLILTKSRQYCTGINPPNVFFDSVCILPTNPSQEALSGLHPFLDIERISLLSLVNDVHSGHFLRLRWTSNMRKILLRKQKKIHIRRITKSPACSMAPEIDHISF